MTSPSSAGSLRPRVRAARPEDAGEIARLREVMYSSFGVAGAVGPWQAGCAAEIARRLREEPLQFTAYVVDHPSVADRLASCGAGWVTAYLPTPMNPSGRIGRIASMSTVAECRRQGYGGAVLDALLGWFTRAGVLRVDLRATVDGEPLYRSRGFTIASGLPMERVAPGARPDDLPTPTPQTESPE